SYIIYIIADVWSFISFHHGPCTLPLPGYSTSIIWKYNRTACLYLKERIAISIMPHIGHSTIAQHLVAIYIIIFRFKMMHTCAIQVFTIVSNNDLPLAVTAVRTKTLYRTKVYREP